MDDRYVLVVVDQNGVKNAITDCKSYVGEIPVLKVKFGESIISELQKTGKYTKDARTYFLNPYKHLH